MILLLCSEVPSVQMICKSPKLYQILNTVSIFIHEFKTLASISDSVKYLTLHHIFECLNMTINVSYTKNHDNLCFQQ